jgi:formate--tetrahydrofolate ligase
MEDINLHFTGDFSAIEKANNFLAAIIDNVIQNHEHEIKLDPRTVVWKRVIDMNDRSLRNIIIGIGGKANGIMRQDGFNITAASEIMAILCLSTSISDLKEKLGNIFVGFTYSNQPVYARDLKAENAMTILLKDAIQPNLVQTLEGNPAIMPAKIKRDIPLPIPNSVISSPIHIIRRAPATTITKFGFGRIL